MSLSNGPGGQADLCEIRTIPMDAAAGYHSGQLTRRPAPLSAIDFQWGELSAVHKSRTGGRHVSCVGRRLMLPPYHQSRRRSSANRQLAQDHVLFASLFRIPS
jgi:hypothetical protein